MPVSSSYSTPCRIIDYVYREVNPTFEKYILPKEKILGKKYSELNPDYSPELPDRYSELNDNRQITFQYYLEKTKTHLTVISIHSKTKGCVDVFGVDNTELVLTQQMLKSTNHKLSAALDAADMTLGNGICRPASSRATSATTCTSPKRR